MTVLLCILLLFFKSSEALNNKTIQNKPLQSSCTANITCPPIEAPLCVRVVTTKQGAVKTSIHIVVVNKCELLYMKCHHGVEAAVVPMKNCDSRHATPRLKPGPIKKRTKRQVDAPLPGGKSRSQRRGGGQNGGHGGKGEDGGKIICDCSGKGGENREETKCPCNDGKWGVYRYVTSKDYGDNYDYEKLELGAFKGTKTPRSGTNLVKSHMRSKVNNGRKSPDDENLKEPDILTKSPYYTEKVKTYPDIPFYTKKGSKITWRDAAYDSDEEDIEKPNIVTKPAYSDDENRNKPITKKPYYSDEDTKKPDIVTKKPYYSDEDTKKPDIVTKKPYYSDEDTKKPHIVTKKPYYSDEETKKPYYSDEDTKKPYNSDEDTKKPNYSDEDTKKPYYSDEDTKKPGIVTKKPHNSDDDRDAPTESSGSDFDSQMKKFEKDMNKFHENFHKTFPSSDTGDGKHKKKLQNDPAQNAKEAASSLKDFQKDVKEFAKDLKTFDNEFSVLKRPANDEKVKIKQPEYKDEDANIEEGIDEEVEKSPEDPDLVMPASGDGIQGIKGVDDSEDPMNDENGEDVENNDQDGAIDKNGGDAENENEREDVNIDQNGENGGYAEDTKNDGEEAKIDQNGENSADAEDTRNDREEAKIDQNDGNGGDSEDYKDVMVDENVGVENNEPNLKLGDWQDYTGECPKECPSRDVMLCARCLHDVYRTFLSTCHLRMFACEQPHEKLQLVSRMPCVASAPFLTDLSDSVKRVVEAQDDDTVLRFIYCRMKGLKGGKTHPAFKGTNAKCDIAA